MIPQTPQIYTLAPDRRAVALLDDDHVLVERFEPPFDADGDNPAGVLRWGLGYEVMPISGATLGGSRRRYARTTEPLRALR